jgi:xylulokinase
MWLNANDPEVVARIRWFVTASTYLGYRLTGELAIDAHTASHWTPLFDPRAIGWTDRFADDITSVDRLPRVGWPADRVGELTPGAAAELGLPAGIPVSLGTVDVVAEAISVGVAEPGDLMVMYGSTTFFLLVTEAPVPAEPLWLTAGAKAGQWMIAAGLATGGSAMAWFRDQFAKDLVAAEGAGGANAFAALAEEARGRDAAAGGRLAFLPYLSGERTPINDPLARGVVAGLSLHSTRGDAYRALMEGIAYAAAANLEAMRELGVPIRRVMAVGGGTADRYLLQLVSDASGVEQRLPRITVGAARGDAFLAGLAAGSLDWSDLAGWVEVIETITPDAAGVARHRDGMAASRRLYADTKSLVHELAAAQGKGGTQPER